MCMAVQQTVLWPGQVCAGLEDGKWLLVKDPNKPLLRLYGVPVDAFKVRIVDRCHDGRPSTMPCSCLSHAALQLRRCQPEIAQTASPDCRRRTCAGRHPPPCASSALLSLTVLHPSPPQCMNPQEDYQEDLIAENEEAPPEEAPAADADDEADDA